MEDRTGEVEACTISQSILNMTSELQFIPGVELPLVSRTRPITSYAQSQSRGGGPDSKWSLERTTFQASTQQMTPEHPSSVKHGGRTGWDNSRDD